MSSMKDMVAITKISVNNELDSYFEDLEVITNDLKPLGKYSEAYMVKNMYFRNSLEEVYDFHPAPQKQYIIYLSGKTKIETSRGESRIFKAGDILLVEDIYGKGHKSSILENGKALVITAN